jgi:hypothetical protein
VAHLTQPTDWLSGAKPQAKLPLEPVLGSALKSFRIIKKRFTYKTAVHAT